MAKEQLCFFGEGVNSRMELIEGYLTKVLDQLDILETGTEGLGAWWEGTAYREWKDTMAGQLAGVEMYIRGMGVVAGTVVELGNRLCETERKNKELVKCFGSLP